MGGYLLLGAFLGCGVVFSEALLRSRCGLIRLWFGLVIGLIMMMWSPIPFAFAMRFTRAAQLCGLDTSLSASEITQTLASYPDGSLVSSYARQPFAYCCRTAILSGSELEPLRPILRCEIAQMLYNLLLQTPLLK